MFVFCFVNGAAFWFIGRNYRAPVMARREERPNVGWPSRKPNVPEFFHGWLLDTHKRVFSQVINENTTCIAELGSWYGASCDYLCREAPNAKVYAVDLWDERVILDDTHYGTDDHRKLSAMLREHPLHDTFLVNLWRYRDRLTPIRKDSVSGLRYLAKLGVTPQVIYIDASHHYEHVKQDISTALDLFPSAVLVGDDYGHYEDVRRAVQECAEKYGKTIHVDTNHCWTYAEIQLSTGRSITPKMQGLASLMSFYKKMDKPAAAGQEKTTTTTTQASTASANRSDQSSRKCAFAMK